MPEILVRKTRAEPGEASIEVTIPPDNVKAAEDRATKVYQQRARLPGFRQGKAPAAVVRKKFADDIRQETLRELVQESWRVAQKQEELKPIADPHIHNLKWEEGAPVTFEFHVELKPDLKLQRLGGFRLTRTVPAVSAAQVDAQLIAMREQRAPWTPVTGEKPKPKDLVDVIIATRENGAVKDPQPYQFVLGEGGLGMYAQAYEIPEERWPKFAEEFRSIAEAQVRRDLVLDYVVESQNLRATEGELDERIQQLAERRGMPAAQLYASLEKAKRLRDVARSITEEKVFAYLLSQSTVEQA